jgi:hypothetical protein
MNKQIYSTPFGRLVKSQFKTMHNFKNVLRISDPTARLYVAHPERMRIKDFNNICLHTGLSREDVFSTFTPTKHINEEND